MVATGFVKHLKNDIIDDLVIENKDFVFCSRKKSINSKKVKPLNE